MTAKHIRGRFLFREVNERGYDLPLGSVTKDGGVEYRSDLDISVWNPGDDVSGYKRVRPDDFVIGLRSFQSGIGHSSIEALVSPAYTVLRSVSERVHPPFFRHLFKSSLYVSRLENVAQGIRQGRTIAAEDFYNIECPVPPLQEQRAIADYLDTETARIDALITKKQRMIELLQLRWRAETAHRMAWIANKFGTVQLRHLVRCLDGSRVPLSTEERSGRTGEYPYYGASGIVDHVDSYLFDETLVLLGEDGAQLGVADYPIAQVVAGKIWVNNHAHVLRPVEADPVFLVLHLNTFDRVPFISGGTREKITQEDMNRIPVPNVDLSRQREEADRLSAIRARSDSASQLLARQIELLREHRQALITAAVTGELKIPGVAA